MLFKKIIVGAIVLTMVIIASTTAQATPQLGVASGTYTGACGQGDYTACFSGSYGTDGWLLGSDNIVTVFTDITAQDIWLVTTAAGATANGNSLNLVTSSGQFDGYVPTTYYGLDLTALALSTSSLDKLAGNGQDPFFGWQLTLGGSFGNGQWFFAVADANHNGTFEANGGGHDSFSPKTSSTQVPEPGMLMLFGSGLLGLGLFGRKKFRK